LIMDEREAFPSLARDRTRSFDERLPIISGRFRDTPRRIPFNSPDVVSAASAVASSFRIGLRSRPITIGTREILRETLLLASEIRLYRAPANLIHRYREDECHATRGGEGGAGDRKSRIATRITAGTKNAPPLRYRATLIAAWQSRHKVITCNIQAEPCNSRHGSIIRRWPNGLTRAFVLVFDP